MTSQEMINDSVAQSIRQEILSMLVCWQRLQETFSMKLSHFRIYNVSCRIGRVLETHELNKF